MADSTCKNQVLITVSRKPIDKIAQLSKKGAVIGKDVAIHESAGITAKNIMIGDSVHIGPNTQIFARSLVVGADVRIGMNCTFRSNHIKIGENSRIGNNNDIQPHALFSMGNTLYIGNQAHIRGREVTFGDEVFITNGLRVGGGGRNEPEAILTVGDRWSTISLISPKWSLWGTMLDSGQKQSS